MGSIISTKVKEDGRIVFEIVVEESEAIQLRGNISNIHIFSEGVADIETNLLQRGKKESTKYFLVPKQLRNDLDFSNKKVKCQRIDTKTKSLFVYVVDMY